MKQNYKNFIAGFAGLLDSIVSIITIGHITTSFELDVLMWLYKR